MMNCLFCLTLLYNLIVVFMYGDGLPMYNGWLLFYLVYAAILLAVTCLLVSSIIMLVCCVSLTGVEV